MSGQSPNSQNIGQVAAGVASSTNLVVHPEYRYWRIEWRKLRDVIAGQREIKRQAELYLRGMKGQDKEDYNNYLDRAAFYNMTGQTLNGMIGQVFMRDPIILNLPKQFKETIRLQFGKDGSSHINFCKTIVSEQIGMGRFGVLVDAPATGSTTPTSYAVGYAAENIMDWTVEEIRGVYKLTRVVLREFTRDVTNGPSQQNPWIGAAPTPAGRRTAQQTQNYNVRGRSQVVQPIGRYVESYTYRTVYRELLLELQPDGTRLYKQNVYESDVYGTPYQQFIPTVRGQPLDFIPFKFFGATSNTADVEKSPLLDIADLNLSHYRTYAELEWGRMYTALPVYYAPGKDNEGTAQYHIGPNLVWEVPSGEKPGIIEYTGQGLKALETALTTKEQQIAAIGGRLMPGAHGRGGESPGQTMLREATEVALILNVIQATESGMAEVVRWWLMWRDVPLSKTEGLQYNVNRDFLASPIGARELRAIQMMYSDGLLPVDVFYSYLVKADVIDATMTLDEFTALLDDPESFINNPDAQARQRGYASRQQELDQATVAREADMQQQEIDLQDRQVTLEENAPPPKIVAPSAPLPVPANPARAAGPVPARPGNKPVKAKKPAAK